jgi:hypothetical protein
MNTIPSDTAKNAPRRGFRLLHKGSYIEEQDVSAAIADQRESYRRAYQPRFLPALRRVRAECALDNSDDVGKLLLHGL